MAKRFIDSSIWTTDEWVKATPESKLLSVYLISSSTNIGIFDQSLILVSMILGFDVTEEKLLNLPIGVEKLGSKYWIPKFCYHQYGELKESCPPHKRYIEDLKKEQLLDRVLLGYQKGIKTLEEKEEDKDKEKDKEKELKNQFFELVKDYPKKDGIDTAFNYFKKYNKAKRSDVVSFYPLVLERAKQSIAEKNGSNQFVTRLSVAINDNFKANKEEFELKDKKASLDAERIAKKNEAQKRADDFTAEWQAELWAKEDAKLWTKDGGKLWTKEDSKNEA